MTRATIYTRFIHFSEKKSKSIRIAFVFIIIALFIISCYDLLFSGYFIWDDKSFLFDEIIIRQSWRGIFFNGHYGMYHPVTTVFIKLTYLLFKNESIYLHALNLLIHIVNSLLFLKILDHFKINFKISFFIFALFLFHPHNIETYAWLTSIKDLLSGFFVMITILYYLKFRKSLIEGDIWKNLTLIIFCTLALLAKPTAIHLPIVIYLLESIHQKRIFYVSKIYLFYATVPLIILIISVNFSTRINASTIFMLTEYGVYEKALIVAMNFYEYSLIALTLSKPSVFYPFPFQPNQIQSIYKLYFIYPIAILAIYFLIKQKFRVQYAGLFMIGLLTLLPVLQIVPIANSVRNDRYAYIFIAYLLAIISLGLALYLKKHDNFWKPAVYVFLTLILSNSIYQFHIRISEWNTQKGLFESDFSRHGKSEILANTLGVIYLNEQGYSKSIGLFSKAIELDSNYVKAYNNLGITYSRLNQTEKAIQMLHKSVNLFPLQYEAYHELAKIYYRIEKYPKADSVMLKRFNPNDDKSLNLLGKIKYQLGDVDKSIELHSHAFKIKKSENYLYDLAISYGKTGNYNKSLDLINEALKMNTKFAEAYYLKGVILLQQGKNPCSNFKMALSLGNEEARPMLDKYCH